ncbi:MAG: NAD(P)-dependent oxidoreductase [Bacteroidales bacterium]|jgi:D-3-phosphoglycerate dehydrogenase
MKKILLATTKPFAKVAVDGIKKIIADAGYELVLLENYTEQEDLIKAISDVDAVIIRSDIVDKQVLEAAKNLKLVVRAGAGTDNVDKKFAKEKDIIVMNTPGQNSNAVGELVAGMMVYVSRNCFNGTSGSELRGKKLGLHAFGYTGRAVNTIAKGFGMEVYAFDPFVKPEAMKAEGVTPVNNIEELYSTCQFVSLHTPATPETINSINYNLLSKMPKNAVLINSARKEVINEADLIKIFTDRPDFKYASDVAPDNSAEIAEKFPGRYFFTPKKMGAQTSEANINAGLAAANQIVNYFKNGDDKYRVN